MVEIQGKVEKIIFYDDINGYAILSIDGCDISINENGSYCVVCKGILNPQVGVSYSFKGEWKEDSYGRKLIAETFEEILPTNLDSIKSYLASGLIKGIGKAYAENIVQTLGEKTLDIIASKSNEIFNVKGLGKKRVEKIWEAWDEHHYLRQLILFLNEYDISMNFIFKIYRRYGNDAIEIIKNDTYRLIRDIEGLGFIKVDSLAIKLGCDREGIKRCSAGIKYVLLCMANDGHVYCDESSLLYETSKLLEVNKSFILNAIEDMINNDLLIKEDNCYFLPNLYEDEINVATKLISMTHNSNNICSYDLNKLEEETGIKYDDIQKEGIQTILTNGISVITGGPGTGKTTILLGAIKALRSNNLTIAAAAPTGKAAKRMREVTGLDAKTIHRLLQFKPDLGYYYNENNQLSVDVVIIDEVSMVNIQLMAILLSAISSKTKLILVGDVDQLPCIGPGNVLLDIIKSQKIPTVTLTKIYRQAENSDIVINSHMVNNGVVPKIKNSKPNTDFFFINETNYDSLLRVIPDLVNNRLAKKYNISPFDIQVLSPMRKNEIGSINLNTVLQNKLNPDGKSINYGKTIFRLNDKVMQIKNNYEKGVFNGETGRIIDVNTEMTEITVDFDGNIINYEKGDFDEVVLAYATTIHKSQGSEYPIVVIPIVRGHYNMMQRNLIYTAITRAKNICVMIGDFNMLKRAVSNKIAILRNTKLAERLKAIN